MNIRWHSGRGILFALIVLCSTLCLGTATAQAPYPSKSTPLKIIVPFGAGSSSDVIARALGRAISEVSGLHAIIENKPGADTIIGVQAVLSAPADGYSLLLVSSSTTVLNPLMVPNQPFDILRAGWFRSRCS